MKTETKEMANEVPMHKIDVGKDTSEDLLKYRLPYLENELTFSRDDRTILTNKMQNNMLERIQYNSSKPQSASNSVSKSSEGIPMTDKDSTESNSKGLTVSILNSLSDGVKSPQFKHQLEDTKLPPLFPASSNFGEKSFKLNGVGLSRSSSMRESPTSQAPRSPLMRSPSLRSPRSKSPYRNYSNSPSPKPTRLWANRNSAPPEYTQIQRTKTEVEIIQQAKHLLSQSGIDGEKVLPQDLQRLGRGVSSLYFTQHDRRKAIPEHISIAGNEEDIPPFFEDTAEKHISMIQTPSLMSRNSTANSHVRHLKASFSPKRRGMRQFQGRFVDSSPQRSESPRRRPYMLMAEKTYLSDPKRSVYKSHESLYKSNENLYQPTELFANPFDIQGRPIHIIPTKERVL